METISTLAPLHHVRLTKRGAPTQAPLHLAFHLGVSYSASLIVVGSAVGLSSSPGAAWYRLGVIGCLVAAVPPFLASYRVQDEPAA